MFELLLEPVSDFLYRVLWLFGEGAHRLLLRLTVVGREHLPRRGPFILASNHVSLIDFIPLQLACRRRLTFLVHRAWYGAWPLRWFFRLTGCLPAEPGQLNHVAFLEALKALERGRAICLFPEGERSWTGELGPGRPGAAYLALQTGAPVVPVAITGTRRMLPRGSWRLRFGRVTVCFGPPLAFRSPGARNSTRSELRRGLAKLMGAITQLLNREEPSPG